jgi:hypothetical protein
VLRKKNELDVSSNIYITYLARFQPIRTLRRHDMLRDVIVIVEPLLT